MSESRRVYPCAEGLSELRALKITPAGVSWYLAPDGAPPKMREGEWVGSFSSVHLHLRMNGVPGLK